MFKSKWKLGKVVGSSRFMMLIGIAILVIAIAGLASLRVWYAQNLKPVSNDTRTSYFTVESGESKGNIATALQRQGLIRSSRAFKTYLKSNEIDVLEAGTYSLSPSMSVQTIVNKMTKGDVTRNLLTILPGKRIDQIKQTFANAGYTQAEIDQAFNPATYTDVPLLQYLPAGASLEGFLYPDSFQKQDDTPASTIVRESLDEMQQYITPDLVNNLAARGLNVYQGITLASIVHQETEDPTYQPTVAQVFLSRLKQNTMLQSDTTYRYAAAIAHQPASVNFDSPYNTYLHTGLPPGPISTFTHSALDAVAHPSNTDFLYFVAGDDGKVHFSHTAQEQQAAIKQYCSKCAQ